MKTYKDFGPDQAWLKNLSGYTYPDQYNGKSCKDYKNDPRLKSCLGRRSDLWKDGDSWNLNEDKCPSGFKVTDGNGYGIKGGYTGDTWANYYHLCNKNEL